MEEQNNQTPTPQPVVQKVETPQPAIENKPKPPFMKYLVLGVIAVLFMAGLVGAYLLGKNQSASQNSTVTSEKVAASPTSEPTPSQDPETAGWKLYTNSEKGFSIKYPSDQFIRLGCPDEGLVLDIRSPQNADRDGVPMESCGRDGRFAIEVQVYDTPGEIWKSSKDFTVNKKTIQIAGYSADEYEIFATPDCFGMCPEWLHEIRLDRAPSYYRFYLGSKELRAVFDKMLTTFKII